MSMDDYVVLWSPHQKCFHMETVDEMLKRNRSIFARQDLGDYIVLSFEKDHAAASDSIKKLRELRDKTTTADDNEFA